MKLGPFSLSTTPFQVLYNAPNRPAQDVTILAIAGASLVLVVLCCMCAVVR